jgi:hypothetical protein
MVLKSFRSFDEFEREVLRPGTRIGLSVEDLVDDSAFDAEVEIDSDDPFSEMSDDY